MRLFGLPLIGLLGCGGAGTQAPIDRPALVSRYLETVGGNTMSHRCWHDGIRRRLPGCTYPRGRVFQVKHSRMKPITTQPITQPKPTFQP